jgi:hypothetical protein
MLKVVQATEEQVKAAQGRFDQVTRGTQELAATLARQAELLEDPEAQKTEIWPPREQHQDEAKLFVSQVLCRHSNGVCADCNDVASVCRTDMGLTLCIRCSGFHEKLLRCLSADFRHLAPLSLVSKQAKGALKPLASDLLLLAIMGNDTCNAALEEALQVAAGAGGGNENARARPGKECGSGAAARLMLVLGHWHHGRRQSP